jgi:hypothetical protein
VGKGAIIPYLCYHKRYVIYIIPLTNSVILVESPIVIGFSPLPINEDERMGKKDHENWFGKLKTGLFEEAGKDLWRAIVFILVVVLGWFFMPKNPSALEETPPQVEFPTLEMLPSITPSPSPPSTITPTPTLLIPVSGEGGSLFREGGEINLHVVFGCPDPSSWALTDYNQVLVYVVGVADTLSQVSQPECLNQDLDVVMGLNGLVDDVIRADDGLLVSYQSLLRYVSDETGQLEMMARMAIDDVVKFGQNGYLESGLWPEDKLARIVRVLDEISNSINGCFALRAAREFVISPSISEESEISVFSVLIIHCVDRQGYALNRPVLFWFGITKSTIGGLEYAITDNGCLIELQKEEILDERGSPSRCFNPVILPMIATQ